MKSENGLEALLRPPVEWYSAFVLMLVAGIAAITPWALMLPWHIGLVVAGTAGYVGWLRLRSGLQVLKYHHDLRYYPVTRIAPHKIPVGPGEYYLGEGFEWTQLHTQRVHEARRPEAKPYTRPGALETGLRQWGAKVQDGSASPMLRAVTGADHWLNPFKPYPDLGGSPVLHGVGQMDEKPVKMRQSSRSGHMVVMGTTRVGKTRMLEMLATQDIHAGHVVIIIDPKGDADLMLRVQAEARRAGRLEQLYLFHLGYPEISARYNGIGSFSRITEVAGRATNALPASGNSAAFKEFSWRFTNIVAQAQVALGRIPTYDTLLRDVTGIEPLFLEYATWYYVNQAMKHGQFKDFRDKLDVLRGLAEAKKLPVDKSLQNRSPEVIAMAVWIRESRSTDNVLLGLLGAVSYDRSFYEKIIASLGPFLEKLISGQVGKLISPDYFDADDDRPIFDWMTVMRQGGIVYAGLDALSDSVVSSAVGNSMLSDLVSVGGKLYKTGLEPHNPEGKISLPTVCCHFDEVNEIAGPEFVPMVNKLGGSGFRITAYTQSFFDIEARVGDKAKAGQIFDNFNHVVMLRVRSVSTANLVAEQVPEVDVVHLTPVSGVTDSAAQGGADFTSRNDDILTTTRTPMIRASDILQLPQGQAIALLEGNRLYKIRIPLADTRDDPFVPQSLRKVAQDMRARYRTSENWAAETDWLGSQPQGEVIDDHLVEDAQAQADAAAAMPVQATLMDRSAA